MPRQWYFSGIWKHNSHLLNVKVKIGQPDNWINLKLVLPKVSSPQFQITFLYEFYTYQSNNLSILVNDFYYTQFTYFDKFHTGKIIFFNRIFKLFRYIVTS